MLALAVLVIVILVVANFGVVWGSNAAFLNADKQETSDCNRVLAVDNEIVGSRRAVEYLPLFAATAMSVARLGEVDKVSVTFNTGAPPDTFDVVAPSIVVGAERTYTIISATKVSTTEMYFTTNEPGAIQRIHVKDGQAHVVATISGVEQWRRPVCEANAECAALVVDTAAEVDELVGTATAALVAAGVITAGTTLGDGVECEVCAAAAAAYAGCAPADKATAGVDSAPACFQHFVSELGLAEAFTLNSLPLTCASVTDSSLGVTPAEVCATLTADVCPATCAPHGRRLTAAGDGATDEAVELANLFVGGDEWEQQAPSRHLSSRPLAFLRGFAIITPPLRPRQRRSSATGGCSRSALTTDEVYGALSGGFRSRYLSHATRPGV